MGDYWTYLLAYFVIVVDGQQQKLKPLVMIHGVNSDYKNMDDISKWAKADFPDMPTFSIDAFNFDWSVVSLKAQVPVFVRKLKNITDQYGQVNLLGYSQGALIARGVVEMGNNPNLHNFISLAAPGLGQYGIPYLNDTMFFDYVASKEVYRICYRPTGQLISVCNYWNDPTEQEKYLEENKFLPYLNNEVPHDDAQSYKDNFARLHDLILIGGSGDDTIQPWQSSQYSFYDHNLDLIPFNQTQYYTKDLFGLKSLDEAGRVKFCTIGGIKHKDWVFTKEVYTKCIKPYIQ